MITHEPSPAEAAKCALLSFDATMRSNLLVAPPIDLLCYREGSLRPEMRSIADDDAYVGRLRARYGRGILELFSARPTRTGSLSARRRTIGRPGQGDRRSRNPIELFESALYGGYLQACESRPYLRHAMPRYALLAGGDQRRA